MLKKILLTAALAALSVSTFADMRTLTEAYEIALKDFRAPQVSGGTVGFRQCEKCDSMTLRVSDNTRYTINEEAVGLTEFRRQLQQLGNRDRVVVLVVHDLDSDLITAVTVSL